MKAEFFTNLSENSKSDKTAKLSDFTANLSDFTANLSENCAPHTPF